MYFLFLFPTYFGSPFLVAGTDLSPSPSSAAFAFGEFSAFCTSIILQGECSTKSQSGFVPQHPPNCFQILSTLSVQFHPGSSGGCAYATGKARKSV